MQRRRRGWGSTSGGFRVRKKSPFKKNALISFLTVATIITLMNVFHTVHRSDITVYPDYPMQASPTNPPSSSTDSPKFDQVEHYLTNLMTSHATWRAPRYLTVDKPVTVALTIGDGPVIDSEIQMNVPTQWQSRAVR